MTGGYFCDKCEKPFKGAPDLEISCTIRGKLVTIHETDYESGEYCTSCGKQVLAAVPWSKE